ncbi:MAG: ferrous iron transporter B [Clostridiales bacterium]|jgi:ferrous iron transport protein B|nr:ferrous iron transporter B [Clostridiales bacterium]
MRFVLAGNPNSGKTTLFNALTGSTAHVGNYPGVTVEKREGRHKFGGERITIVDLPGIYSLSPYSPEEVVSRNVILDEKPDAIINIVDATNLERNLYLTTQLSEIDAPLIVALNMTDLLERDGIKLDYEELSKALRAKVVPVSALKKQGLKALIEEAVLETKRNERKPFSPLEGTYLDGLLKKADTMYKESRADNALFHAVKAIEGDSVEVAARGEAAAALEPDKKLIKNDFDGDFEGMVADLRYKYIDGFIKKVTGGRRKTHQMTRSDKVDRVLTHRIWGIPIFLLIMLTVFHLTFGEDLLYLGAMGLIPEAADETFLHAIFGNGAINSPGVILFNLVDGGTGSLTELLAGVMPEGTWYTGLVIDGLGGGVFAVLSFIPQIMVLFLFLSILEDTGYMARVAFIMDRAFRRFGLSGKALVPLITCFGCAVPGVMATRTLENEKERKMTILLAPFFSCGAKLPIWAMFGGLLYAGQYGDLVVFGMYIIGIAVAVASAVILKLTALKGETPPFIMELPSYHSPQFTSTALKLWQRLKHYVFRAATIIAGAVVVIWFLSSFGFDFWNGIVDIGDSMLGIISKVLRWLFVPLGFAMGENGWMFVVAALTGLIAKEMVVATMGVLAGISGDALELEGGELQESAIGLLVASMVGGAPAAWAYMAFNLLSVPCMAAVGAAAGELKNKKAFWFSIGYWMATAYIGAAVIYWVGTYWWIGLIIGALLAGVITYFQLTKKRRARKQAGKKPMLSTR